MQAWDCMGLHHGFATMWHGKEFSQHCKALKVVCWIPVTKNLGSSQLSGLPYPTQWSWGDLRVSLFLDNSFQISLEHKGCGIHRM